MDISISYGFYIDSFTFWKCQVILKSKAESLYWMMKFTIVKKTNVTTVERNAHIFRKYFCHSFSPFIFRKKISYKIQTQPTSFKVNHNFTNLYTVYIYLEGTIFFYFYSFLNYVIKSENNGAMKIWLLIIELFTEQNHDLNWPFCVLCPYLCLLPGANWMLCNLRETWLAF